MENRFKFRVWSNKYNKYIENFIYPIGSDHQLILNQEGQVYNLGLGDYEYYSEDTHSWGTFEKYEDCIIQQCTGLQDKNGKLIYEGDIVRYADIENPETEWEYDEIVWGGKYSYPAFDLANCQFDCNGLSYIFNEGWIIEIVGNTYKNLEKIRNAIN